MKQTGLKQLQRRSVSSSPNPVSENPLLVPGFCEEHIELVRILE
jgi:hypothetical protein